MNVLLADDDRVVSHLLSARLRAAGWTVNVAQDAMQTVMFAIRTIPDAIVLDINMPGGNGVDALRKIRASVKTAMIPVIVLSGSTDAAVRDAVRELDVADFLEKPADPDVLIEVLSRLTRERGAPPR